MENVPSTKLKPIDCLYDAANSTKVPTGLPDAVKISGQAALMADAAKASLHRAEAPGLGFVASSSVARRITHKSGILRTHGLCLSDSY